MTVETNPFETFHSNLFYLFETTSIWHLFIWELLIWDYIFLHRD